MAPAGETVIAAAGAGLMVTEAEAVFVVSLCKIAVTVSVETAETLAGALYEAVAAPDGVIVPTEALPPFRPFTCQVTAGFVEFSTVTVKASVPPACI